MFCEHCGTQIDPNSQFCAHCGAKVDDRFAAPRAAGRLISSHRENKPKKKLQTILVLSIPTALIALVVVWFLSGTFGTRGEGFEKFLPENTAYYVEIYDPIGLLADFEHSTFFKRVAASPEWKEWEKDKSDLSNLKNILPRLVAVRNVVGPVGIAAIPSFSETGLLVFVRLDRGYVGAARVSLEQFLDTQNVKYRKSQHAGKIRYDLEMAPNYSFVLMDSGIVASDSPAILDRYIDWLETNGKSNLGNSDNFRKINSRKSGPNARARIYFDSSTFLNSLNKAGSPSGFTSLIIANFQIAAAQVLTNVPSWVGKAQVSFDDGIYLSSSFSFSQQSPLTKKMLQAVRKPISNSSLQYLPKDVVAFTTANVMTVWEVAKEEIRRQGAAGGRESEVEKLLQTLSGEAVFAWVPENQQQFPWGDVIGAEQKAPAEFITALEELSPEIKSVRQIERYGEHDIRCYSQFFGTALCLANVDNYVFASPNKQAIYKILDVKDGKAVGFQQTMNANAKLNRLFTGNRHGIIYYNLKDITKHVPLTLWGNPQELAIKEKIANAPSPFYLAGAADVSGDVINGEATLVFDVPAFESLLTSLAEESFKSYRARGVQAGIAAIPPHQGYVNDFARVISPVYQRKIAEVAKTLEHKKTAQLVVVTVESTKPESIDEYATKLVNTWGIGQRGKDNGILLLVAVRDRRVRIEVGSGLERLLPDSLAQKILHENILPHLRKGDYSKATEAGVEALYDHLLHSGQDRERNCYGGIWRENQLNQFRWTIELSDDGLHIERTDGFVKGTFVRSGAVWNGTLSWGNGDTWNGVVLYRANEACNEIRTNQRWWFKR